MLLGKKEEELTTSSLLEKFLKGKINKRKLSRWHFQTWKGLNSSKTRWTAGMVNSRENQMGYTEESAIMKNWTPTPRVLPSSSSPLAAPTQFFFAHFSSVSTIFTLPSLLLLCSGFLCCSLLVLLLSSPADSNNHSTAHLLQGVSHWSCCCPALQPSALQSQHSTAHLLQGVDSATGLAAVQPACVQPSRHSSRWSRGGLAWRESAVSCCCRTARPQCQWARRRALGSDANSKVIDLLGWLKIHQMIGEAYNYINIYR